MGIVLLKTQNKKILQRSCKPALTMDASPLPKISTALKSRNRQNNSQGATVSEILLWTTKCCWGTCCCSVTLIMALSHWRKEIVVAVQKEAAVVLGVSRKLVFALQTALPLCKAEEFAQCLLALRGKCAKSSTPSLCRWPTSHTSPQISSCLVMQSGGAPLSICCAQPAHLARHCLIYVWLPSVICCV